MYTIYFNFETKAHTIVNDAIVIPLTEDDVIVENGTLQQCKDYLEPLNIIYQTIDVPTFDSSGFTEEDNYIE